MGDWRITDEHRPGPPSYGNGALKLWLLDSGTAVAYAGVRSYADLVLRTVAAGSRAERLHALSAATQTRRVEFLVATLEPVELLRVDAGRVLPQGRHAWIGDPPAYDVFHNHIEATPRAAQVTELPRHLAEWLRITQAFDATVRDASAASVGELAVSVIASAAHHLEYATAAALVAEFKPQVIPSGIPTIVGFGTAADGGFGYSIMTPHLPTPALGLYFPYGRAGQFHWPLRLDEPVAYANVSQVEFAAAVSREHGIELSGVGIS
jgi:hypothetical protein